MFVVVNSETFNKDTIGSTVSCPVYRGGLRSKESSAHMSAHKLLAGFLYLIAALRLSNNECFSLSNGVEQWCPAQGGGCISEVSFNRGFTVQWNPRGPPLLGISYVPLGIPLGILES